MLHQGHLYIISAPSGAGKTSLVDAITKVDPKLTVSISHTTRAPRPGEENGKNYYFVSEAEFKNRLSEALFLEHATVFGNYYGTSKEFVTAQLAKGQDVILEIDWQGAAQVRQAWPEAISIFIFPPSLDTLAKRLSNRGQDEKSVIAKRLAGAQAEMRHSEAFEYWVINDDFERAKHELLAIFEANCLKQAVQYAKHSGLIQDLLA